MGRLFQCPARAQTRALSTFLVGTQRKKSEKDELHRPLKTKDMQPPRRWLQQLWRLERGHEVTTMRGCWAKFPRAPRLPRDSLDLGLTPRRKTWRVQTSGGGVVDMSVVLVVFPIHMKASTSFRASATYEKTHPGRCQKTTGLSFHALSLYEIDSFGG